MADIFKDHTPSLTSPIVDGQAITPNDGTTLPQVTRALYVATSGDLTVELQSGSTVTLSGIGGGAVQPLRVRKVFSSGTTAGGIVGLW